MALVARGVNNPTGQPSRFGYRPGLDGLRAVAVLAVILYHLGYRWTRGGFLGVDIFFVLSGYLITSLLLTEQVASGRVHFANFWARRAKRLFPALALMLVATALCIHQFESVQVWPMRRQDLLWTIFYTANWHQIASSQDYFAQWFAASPLQHMWSLAIEEQFYLVWPVIILLLTRRLARFRLAAAIGVLIVISVAVMVVVYDPADPSRAYYGTDSRAQELLVGALLAVLMMARPVESSRPWRHASWVGLLASAAMLVAVAFMPDRSPLYYHGGSTVFSAAVAILIWSIEVSPGSLLARSLGFAVPRWIGKISYGLYLWHWPAILFTSSVLYELMGEQASQVVANTVALNMARLGLTLSAATVSYYIVERPIRQGHIGRLLTNARLRVVAPATAACVVAIALIATQIPVASQAATVQTDFVCPNATLVCVSHKATDTRPTIALMGDSIAQSLDPALARFSQRNDWTYVAATRNRCSLIQRWVADYTTQDPIKLANYEACYNSIPQIDAGVLSHRPNVIVATDRWLLIDSLTDSGQRLTAGTDSHIRDTEDRLTITAASLTSTGATLVFIHILPVGQPMNCAKPQYSTAAVCNVRASDDTLTPKYNSIMDRIAAGLPDRIKVIDLSDVVCPKDQCSPILNGIPIREDGLHFTVSAALWLEPFIEAKLRQVGVGPA